MQSIVAAKALARGMAQKQRGKNHQAAGEKLLFQDHLRLLEMKLGHTGMKYHDASRYCAQWHRILYLLSLAFMVATCGIQQAEAAADEAARQQAGSLKMLITVVVALLSSLTIFISCQFRFNDKAGSFNAAAMQASEVKTTVRGLHTKISENGWARYLKTHSSDGWAVDQRDSTLAAHSSFLRDVHNSELGVQAKLNGLFLPYRIRARTDYLMMDDLYESKLLEAHVSVLRMYIYSFIMDRQQARHECEGASSSTPDLTAVLAGLIAVRRSHSMMRGKAASDGMLLPHRPFLSVLCGIPCPKMRLLAAQDEQDQDRTQSGSQVNLLAALGRSPGKSPGSVVRQFDLGRAKAMV
jgi:hypothetical protein